MIQVVHEPQSASARITASHSDAICFLNLSGTRLCECGLCVASNFTGLTSRQKFLHTIEKPTSTRLRNVHETDDTAQPSTPCFRTRCRNESGHRTRTSRIHETCTCVRALVFEFVIEYSRGIVASEGHCSGVFESDTVETYWLCTWHEWVLEVNKKRIFSLRARTYNQNSNVAQASWRVFESHEVPEESHELHREIFIAADLSDPKPGITHENFPASEPLTMIWIEEARLILGTRAHTLRVIFRNTFETPNTSINVKRIVPYRGEERTRNRDANTTSIDSKSKCPWGGESCWSVHIKTARCERKRLRLFAWSFPFCLSWEDVQHSVVPKYLAFAASNNRELAVPLIWYRNRVTWSSAREITTVRWCSNIFKC